MSTDRQKKLIARIYFLGAFMLIVQVALGGITRLTGSGLSITSWDVITGAIPPLSEDAWTKAFADYKQTPQYLILNRHFSLSDFKFIFFWEWAHRLWARCVAFLALACLCYLWKKKYLDKAVLSDFLLVIALGGLQGLIGWIMVKSGLSGDAVYVAPGKLAIHFVLAVILICVVWTLGIKYFSLEKKTPSFVYNKKLSLYAYILFICLLGQMIWGCFLAGTRSAAAASTWPTINGMWAPDALSSLPFSDWFTNGVCIHFMHRTIGYALFLLICIWTYVAVSKKLFQARFLACIPLCLAALQIVLGVLSILLSSYIKPNAWGGFEWMAQLHQIVAILLALSFVSVLYLFSFFRPKPQRI